MPGRGDSLFVRGIPSARLVAMAVDPDARASVRILTLRRFEFGDLIEGVFTSQGGVR
jgi:hypothetical protein